MPWHSPTILTRQQLLILSLVSEALLTYISSFVRYVRLESTIYENLVGLTEVYPQQRCTVTPQCAPSESLVTPLQ